jgi:hypothetical protein
VGTLVTSTDAREPEVDADRLRESIDDPPSASLLRSIALTTALLAAVGSVAALQAGGTVNEALVLKTEAARLQSEASDQWAYYQAKGVKASVEETAKAVWEAAGKTPPPTVDRTIERYAAEQKEIERAARDKERERDEKSAEADGLIRRHERFANSVAFIQVSIALGAVAALTRNRIVWFGSVALGAIGTGMFLLTLSR